VLATRPPTRPAPAAGRPARRQRYRRRQTTDSPTDNRHQRAKQYWPI